MKKTFIWVCTTLLALASCSENEEAVQNINGYGTINATIENGASRSRVAINDKEDGGATLAWVTTDQFKTFGSNEATYSYNGTDFGLDAGQTEPTSITNAVYPASQVTSLAEGVLTMTLPDEFTNTMGQSLVPMWAGAIDANNNLSFKHLAALLKIDLSGVSEFAKIVVTADKAIAGTFAATLADNCALQASQDNTDGTTVTITLSDVTDGAEVIYLPIPATTYTSLSVKAVKDGNTEKVLRTWANQTFERAYIYTATIMNEVTSLADVSSALNDLQENPEAVLNISADITTSTNNATITIPVVEDADVTLNFTSVTTSADAPLVIESNADATVGEATQALTINLPETENDATGADLEINTPTTTVTLGSGTYGTISATTATNTLIIGKGVTVDKIIAMGGNILIKDGGMVKEFARPENDATDPITIKLDEDVTLAGAFVIAEGGNFVLDLNQFTLTNKAGNGVLNKGTLEIKNGAIVAEAQNMQGLRNEGNGSAILNCTITSKFSNAISHTGSGTLTINGGSYTSELDGGQALRMGNNNTDYAWELYINGGTFTAPWSALHLINNYCNLNPEGKAEIKNATFNGSNGTVYDGMPGGDITGAAARNITISECTFQNSIIKNSSNGNASTYDFTINGFKLSDNENHYNDIFSAVTE